MQIQTGTVEQSPFLAINCQLQSLIKYLDKNLLILENHQHSFHKLNQKHHSFLSNHYHQLTHANLKLLTDFLIQEKLNNLSRHIDSLINDKITSQISSINTIITQIITHSSQLYEFFQSYQTQSPKQFNLSITQHKPSLFQQFIESQSQSLDSQSQSFDSKINKILKKNFDFDLHNSGFSKSTLPQSFINMEFLQYNQLKSKDSKTLQLQQKNILDQIQSMRTQIFNTNTIQSSHSKDKDSQQDLKGQKSQHLRDKESQHSKDKEQQDLKNKGSQDLKTKELQDPKNKGSQDPQNKESPKKAYSKLFDLYQQLNNINRFKCICPKLIYPILKLPQNKDNKSTQIQQNTSESNIKPQIPQSNRQPQTQSSISPKFNSISFKIQAQGFTSKNALQLPSIRQKLQQHLLKTNHQLNHQPSKNISSLNKPNSPLQFSKFQQNLIKITDVLNQNQQEKYFQFGFIDASRADNFINSSALFSVAISQNILIQDINLKTIFQDQSECNKLPKHNQFSLKILNIDNKFFIQSQKQAKLIKLNPKWEYFSLKLVQPTTEKSTLPQIKLYGNIKKPPNSSTQEFQVSQNPFQQQLILTCFLSPSLRTKVLKPFFSFKNFHCKIHIINF